MKEIKILIVTGGLNNGGKEKQTLEAIKALGPTNINTYLLVLKKNQFHTSIAKTIADNFYETNRGFFKLKPFYWSWKIISKCKPDIVHTWDTISSFYALPLCRLFNIKFVEGSIRDCGIDHGFEFLYKKFFLTRSDLIIANSFKGLKTHKVKGEVIYNSIDPTKYQIQKSNNSLFNIVMIGNFHGYKDQKTFIDASYILLKEGIIDFVYLLGEGPKKRACIDYINSSMSDLSDNFLFTGTVRNVEHYLAKCSVGVLCSTNKHKEGLSNAILEYMAAGLVSIATDTGGTSEIINHYENGFLIQPQDSNSIVKYVGKIKYDKKLEEKILINAQETLRKKFSIRNYSTALPKLYYNLLKL